MNTTEQALEATKFRDFLQAEIERRGMSVRQFAELCDVSHSVIVRATQEGDPHIPSLPILAQIANAINVNLMTIITMIYPDASQISSDAWLLAQQIDKLPDADRRYISNAIVGALMKVQK